MKNPLPPFSVSHVGLYVFDLDAMVEFYTEMFGLHVTDRGVVRGAARIAFLSRDATEHHQIVLVEGRDVPLGQSLLNQISLRVADLAALRASLTLLEADGRVTEIMPVNHGNAFSIYFCDPEGNRFEVFADSPFYVQQAVIEPLQLRQGDEALVEETRARHADDPTFRPAAEWRAEFARRLAAERIVEERVIK